jgi:hypothetical protein
LGNKGYFTCRQTLIRIRPCGHYVAGVSKRTTPSPAKLRSWQVTIIRSRGEYLGSVETAVAKSGQQE